MFRKCFAFCCLVFLGLLSSTLVIARHNNFLSEEKSLRGSEGELCTPIGSFIIDPPESIIQKRASVKFPHSKHFDYNCAKCHHKWEGNSVVRNCTASDCHDVMVAPEKPLKNGSFTEQAIKYYKYAYHEQCRKCHMEVKAKRAEMVDARLVLESKLPVPGPTGCIECHPKEK